MGDDYYEFGYVPKSNTPPIFTGAFDSTILDIIKGVAFLTLKIVPIIQFVKQTHPRQRKNKKH